MWYYHPGKVDNSLSPRWGASFEFAVHDLGSRLGVAVWDWDFGEEGSAPSPGQGMGQASLRLDELRPGVRTKVAADLTSCRANGY